MTGRSIALSDRIRWIAAIAAGLVVAGVGRVAGVDDQVAAGAIVAAAVVGWLSGRLSVRPGVASSLAVVAVATFASMLWGLLLVATIFALSGDLGIADVVNGPVGQAVFNALVHAAPIALVVELATLVWIGLVRLTARAARVA